MSKPKHGILLINLGTPNAPDPKSVGKYLREFLSDGSVIDINPIFRWPLVNCIIVPFRKKKSAKAYQKIWTDKGSPLLLETMALKEKLDQQLPEDTKITVGMRYGRPSIESALLELKDCEIITVLPLYPQETKSSYGTARDKVNLLAKKYHLADKIRFIAPFFDQDFYIDALVNKISAVPEKFDHYLFSYHGIPVSHHECCKRGGFDCELSSCYRTQCFKSSELIAEKLGLAKEQYTTAFQSRLGRQEWIKPYTDHVLEELKERNIKRLAVLSPSFIADCLETLEEIDMEYREVFEDGQERSFTYIPCLNSDTDFVNKMSSHLTL